jgi:hypothetical protein
MQWAVGEVVPEKGAVPASRLMGQTGKANGVPKSRSRAEEFADGEEPDCGGRTRFC